VSSSRLVALPPRHSLPRDVVVPVLPGLGFTWYDRSGNYWTRRIGLSLMWALVTALITLLTVFFLGAFRPGPGFAVLLGIEVAYSLGFLAFFMVRTARAWNDPPPARQVPPRSGAARARSLPGQALLAIGFLFIGFYLALLVTSLLPETPAERRARLQVAEELRGRGHLAPGP
jgi:hypothetical protein